MTPEDEAELRQDLEDANGALEDLYDDIRPLLDVLRLLYADGMSPGRSAYTAFVAKHPELLLKHEREA